MYLYLKTATSILVLSLLQISTTHENSPEFAFTSLMKENLFLNVFFQRGRGIPLHSHGEWGVLFM